MRSTQWVACGLLAFYTTFALFDGQENCKVTNLREGEAPAEPKGFPKRLSRSFALPCCHSLNDFAVLLVRRGDFLSCKNPQGRLGISQKMAE
jgi:hypothetical protein